MKKIAVFPGSFSPFTLGHKSVVDTALPLFEKIIIAIGTNDQKKSEFSLEKRKKWIKSVYIDNPKVEVSSYDGLTVDYCDHIKSKYIIRGLRNSKDFEYEKQIAITNNKINNNIETIFILTSDNVTHISSTIIRDIIKNGGDASQFLPEQIKI